MFIKSEINRLLSIEKVLYLMAESEVFIISLLSIIFIAIQIIINLYFDWKRDKFDQKKHEDQLNLEKQDFKLKKKELRLAKNQYFMEYQTKIQEIQLQTTTFMITFAEKLGLDLSKGDFESQVQSILKKAQPNKKDQFKAKKEQLKSTRKPKK